MARDDSGLLQHLGGEVLQDGREVDRGELAHPENIKDENNKSNISIPGGAGNLFPTEAVDSPHGEEEAGSRRPGPPLSDCVAQARRHGQSLRLYFSNKFSSSPKTNYQM